MPRTYTDTSCPLYGSEYCAILNMEDCGKCPVSAETAAGIKVDVDAVTAMLPEGGIYPLFAGDTCMLCKGEKKRPAVCFAMTDIGNMEPKRTGRNALGLKTKLKIGSLLPLQISCCAECRKKIKRISDKHIVLTIAVAVVLMVLLNIPTVLEALAGISRILPLAAFVVGTGATYLIARLRRKNLIKKYSEATYLNVMDTPIGRELAKKNWFELNRHGEVSRFIFAKEPLKQGIYTGIPEKR